MATRNYLLFVLLIGLASASCDLVEKRERKKCEGQAVLGFEFDIPYHVRPARDTFSLGDTIWIESSFSNQMVNRSNGKVYTLSHFDFKISGVILDLETNPSLPATATAYDMVDAGGQVYTADRSGPYFYVQYRDENNQYYWKAGFVLKKAGLFAFWPDTNIDEGNLKEQMPPQQITACNYESVLLRILRKDIDPNTDLLLQAADPYVREPWDIGPFELSSFAFYVKE